MPAKSKSGLFLHVLQLGLFSMMLTVCVPVPGPRMAVTPAAITPTVITPTAKPQETVSAGVSTPDPLQLPAFPGAEGFGSTSPGGRGGKVIEVTNLNDSGAGSLRAAIDSQGPRIITFRVAGTIELASSLAISNPYVTLAGQTAPGGGVTLRGVNASMETLILVETHDVVIRYLTLRAGPPSAGDGLEIFPSHLHDTYNVVIDHNSLSWAVNRNLATWYDLHDISIQWNIFSEGLNCSIHAKGCHSKGALLGGYASDENKDKPGASNISFHHNLMAHNVERNPLISTSGVTDVVNNVAYNSQGSFSHVDFQSQLTVIPANYVANYFKDGPDTDPNKFGIDVASPPTLGAKIFLQGNIGPHRFDATQPEIDIADPDARPFVVTVRNPAAPVTTTSALVAYDQVLAGAGANLRLGCDGTWQPRRDAIDTRIVNEVRNILGKIIDDPSQVGGWLAIPPAEACADADHDGMPDAWEGTHGLNPKDPADALLDLDRDGYTNIEEFLNSTDPSKK